MSLIAFIYVIMVYCSLTFMAEFISSDFIALCLVVNVIYLFILCLVMIYVWACMLRLKDNFMAPILSYLYVNSKEQNEVTWLSWKALLVTELSHTYCFVFEVLVLYPVFIRFLFLLLPPSPRNIKSELISCGHLKCKIKPRVMMKSLWTSTIET